MRPRRASHATSARKIAKPPSKFWVTDPRFDYSRVRFRWGGHGDHQGIEFGLSSEYIPIQDLGGLGSKSNASGDYNYLNVSFAKGLPYNVDTSVQFTPIPQSGGAFGYGAQLRWGFYEFLRFPAVLSVVAGGSGMNYGNVLSTRTTGFDLIMTVAVEDAALYFGGGTIRTIGTFTGGVQGITADGTTKEEDLSNLHSVFGLNFNFAKYFLALEVDRVKQSTYAGRMGFRF